MTDGNDFVHTIGDVDNFNGGLTKREYFAAMAMKGMLANPDWNRDVIKDPLRVGRSADSYADGLIEALNEGAK